MEEENWKDSLPEHVTVDDGWLTFNGEQMRINPSNSEQVEVYSPSGYRTVALSNIPLGPMFWLKELADEQEVQG